MPLRGTARSYGLCPVTVTLCAILLLTPCALAKKTIRWWSGGNASWDHLGKEYMKLHPDVTIVNLSGEMDKFYTMITAGLMPDVWGPWGTPGIKADVNRNWATDLTPFIKADAKEIDLNDFYPGVMAKFRVAAKQYSLACFAYQDYFFYNPQMYASAGLVPPPLDASDKSWNWDQMVQNGEKTTTRSADGQTLKVSGIEFARDILHGSQYLYMWGAPMYSEQAVRSSVPQEMLWDNPQTLRALTKAYELIYKERISSPIGASFQSSKASQALVPGWYVTNYVQTKNLKWAIANLPWGTTDGAHMNPDGWRIGKASKNKPAAWDFVKFLCSPSSLRYLATDPKSPYLGTPMARRSVFADTLAQNISKATGMRQADVLTVHGQADLLNEPEYLQSICIHADISPFLEPIMARLWADKASPAQTAKALQEMSNKRLPELFKRWIRNVQFTGADK